MKMNPEVKALWTEALRSGDFLQGVGALTSITAEGEKQYCCLGVLCKVAADKGIVTEVGGDSYNVTYDENTAYLPESVINWAGLEDNEDPELTDDDDDDNYREIPASSWNDVYNAGFHRIADLIDSNL